jgi:hypothetical protein
MGTALALLAKAAIAASRVPKTTGFGPKKRPNSIDFRVRDESILVHFFGLSA